MQVYITACLKRSWARCWFWIVYVIISSVSIDLKQSMRISKSKSKKKIHSVGEIVLKTELVLSVRQTNLSVFTFFEPNMTLIGFSLCFDGVNRFGSEFVSNLLVKRSISMNFVLDDWLRRRCSASAEYGLFGRSTAFRHFICSLSAIDPKIWTFRALNIEKELLKLNFQLSRNNFDGKVYWRWVYFEWNEYWLLAD